jgi:hypothetical protein
MVGGLSIERKLWKHFFRSEKYFMEMPTTDFMAMPVWNLTIYLPIFNLTTPSQNRSWKAMHPE